MQRPLRILLITGEYPPMEGGVADYTYLLAQEMARQKACVTVVTSASAGQERLEGTVRCLPWITGWDCINVSKQVKRAVTLSHPDFIHIQYQTAAYQMKPAINLLPVMMPRERFCVTFHDLREPYLFPKAGRVRRWITHLLAQQSTCVFVTNIEDQQQLAADTRVGNLHLIPIGSNIVPTNDSRLISTLRERWHLGGHRPIIGYFGMINSSKGVSELLQAVSQVRAAGEDAALLIIGGGTGSSDSTNVRYLASVRQEIVRLVLDNHVTWTGHLSPEETSAALRCVDMAVLPYHDGASFRRGSLMAALAHGLPIISTQPAKLDPRLISGENILLVSPRDAAAVAQAISLLAHDRALSSRLAAGAAQLAERFSWQMIARQTLEVLNAAVAG